MSLWLLIDGYNIVSPIAPPGRSGASAASDPMWLHRERMSLMDRLAEHLPPMVRDRSCVVFDAKNPPPDVGHEFVHHGIQVRFAVDYPEADDLIEEMIAAESVPRSLMVVSTDRRIQTAASRRGAMAMDSDPWFDWLLDGRIKLAVPPSKYADEDQAGQGRAAAKKSAKPSHPEGDEVKQWMQEFGFGDPSEKKRSGKRR